MKPTRYIHLLSLFYRSFILFSLIVDAVAALLYRQYGSGIFPLLWLLKSGTLLLTWFTINRRKKNEYYYYYNQGISRKQIWIPLLLFDLLLFIVITCCFHA
ncbi:hypothetical protein [Niabella drilacis]|uniref:Uncharacterized protein n=1 Tax=Niabella drilacis (strain DSM 25811 / CCM 8410 / CCUG 62505 / LMG 26954 / E90) TaxID=1285928 RepID=A0A1G7BKY3_NIADE|nr:hypothetical protein [Niabella drilacis]SDE27761.1 hypothetical protein SAMN04487894_1314 [Niabella drilacis]